MGMDKVRNLFSHPMVWYVTKRLLQSIPVFIGATFLIYSLVFLQPGDPVRAMFGDKQPTEATLAAVRAEYGLDKPFIFQYLTFLINAVTLHFPNTFSGRPIMDVISTVLPNTLALALMAFFFEALIGIVLGVISGMKKNSIFDSVTLFVTLLIVSVPPLVLGFILQYLLGTQAKLIPPTVGQNIDFYHLLIPSLILASVSIATVVRLTRAEVSSVRGADYVRTAKAKGLEDFDVTLKHILRNSLIPVITYLGNDFVALMSGAVITETIFNINGIGNQLFKFITQGEGAAVVSIVTIFLMFYIVCNIIIDILYAAIDPRIRLTKEGV